MGKVKKRQATRHSNHHDNPNRVRGAVVRRQHSQNVTRKIKAKSTIDTNPGALDHKQQSRAKVPFCKWDRVLLVGEGDFTFALSLFQNHRVGHIVATCFDSEDVLEEKYPQVRNTLRQLGLYDAADTNHGTLDAHSAEWRGFSPDTDRDSPDQISANKNRPAPQPSSALFFGVDATKLTTAHKRILRAHSPFTKIVFNFPHVGGLSTDVNRQVRSNQQLLVDFFNAAKPLLATTSTPAKPSRQVDEEDYYEQDYDSDRERQHNEHLKHGQILVTLFEGEPYSLWNIRDLARHSGLKVLESFKFPWTAYPGYRHARTIGDIVTGRDRSDDGKRKGAWRGEERDARCYVLALREDNGSPPISGPKKRKDAEDDSD